MKPNLAARIAAVVLAVAGVSLLIAAGLVATRDFEVRLPAQPNRAYDCGSVLFAKDPRNLGSRGAEVPLAYKRAYNRCEQTRSDRTKTTMTFMVAGAIPLLLLLTLPAISRRSRRARTRRRIRL